MKTNILSAILMVLLASTLLFMSNIQKTYSIEASKTDVQCELENVEWCQTYGGADWEEAWCVIQTSDGGYAMAGSVQYPPRDFLLIKTDLNGNVEWSKTYGGSNDDWAFSIIETVDGGYLMAGETKSFGVGGWDFWLVKTDVLGNHEWNGTYGGVSDDAAHSIIEVDGGYVIVGNTNSFGQGSGDIWLIKTDLDGNTDWSQTYGGTGDEDAWSVVETGDGGFAIGGWTESLGGGSRDFWLVRTNSIGDELWNQTYGGPKREHLWSMIQTDNGGFALTGSDNYGSTTEDLWIIKTDLLGNEEWNRTYGGSVQDYSHSIIQTLNGDYAIGGWTMSFGAGGLDGWLLIMDSDGEIKCNQTFGGTDMDALFSIIQTDDAGFALTGITLSYGAGSADVWLIKLAPEITWEYIFEDPCRGTELRISTDDKYFQFVAPDKEFPIAQADKMEFCGNSFYIYHKDENIRLLAFGSTRYEYCVAFVKDMQTGQYYFLYDRPDWYGWRTTRNSECMAR